MSVERAALQVGAPGVVGEVAVVEPVLPVVGRPDQPVVGLLVVARAPGARTTTARRTAVSPSFISVRRGGPRALEADVHVGGERAARHRCPRALATRLVVAGRRCTPSRRRPAVVEARLAVERHLHLAVDAAHQAQQHVIGVVVGRRAPVGVRAVVLVVPGADQQHVADDDPAAARAPARLEHHRPRQVAARGGHVTSAGAEPEHAGVAVEHRAEHARRVEARQAEPLDVAVRRHQRARLAVRQEAVVGDRRERARCRSPPSRTHVSQARARPLRPAARSPRPSTSEAGAPGRGDPRSARHRIRLVLAGHEEHDAPGRVHHRQRKRDPGHQRRHARRLDAHRRRVRARPVRRRPETASRCGHRGRCRAGSGRSPAARRLVLALVFGRHPRSGRARPSCGARRRPRPHGSRASSAMRKFECSWSGATQRSSVNQKSTPDQSLRCVATRS